MSEPNVDSSRRDFLRAAAGTATVTGASGTAAAAESGGNNSSGGGGGGGGQPDYGGWMEQAGNYSSTSDMRGQKEVTIKVGASGNGGAYAFDPPAVWVDTGTKVTWEWTGEGGGHNVVDDAGNFESKQTAEAGFTFEQTFEESQIVKYFCEPHKGLGMVGAVAVGDDIPTVQPSTGGGAPTLPDSAKTLGIASGFAMVTTLGLAYFFMKYGGDYDELGE